MDNSLTYYTQFTSHLSKNLLFAQCMFFISTRAEKQEKFWLECLFSKFKHKQTAGSMEFTLHFTECIKTAWTINKIAGFICKSGFHFVKAVGWHEVLKAYMCHIFRLAETLWQPASRENKLSYGRIRPGWELPLIMLVALTWGAGSL